LEHVVTFSNVPWAVGGGAVIPEDVARMIPYFMFNKTEGVLGSTDLEVKALATPGSSIRVSPGGFVVLGRGSGQFYEAYMGKNPSDHILSVAANNSASSRSDLVVARVIDPYVAGSPWNIPTDRANGPYVEPFIIQGVPSTIRTIRSLGNNWSAIDLARIDIPANTATITQAMIVSLRSRVSAAPAQVPPPSTPAPVPDVNIYIDNPENEFFTLLPGPSTQQLFPSTQKNVWRSWPAISEIVVPIPNWATTMDAQFSLLQAHTDNDVWGETRIEVGSAELYSQSVVYDFNKSTGGERIDIYAGGRMTIPSAMRGQNKRFRVNARSLDIAPAEPGTMYVDRGSLIRLEVVFKEQVS
jgi:hypothetical protein